MEITSCDNLMLAFGLPGGSEWIILLVLGLLIFGRRLPEVGRSLGRGIVEFKRGVKGIEDEVEEASSGESEAKKLPKPSTATPKLTEKTDSSASEQDSGEKENPYAQTEQADEGS